MPSSAGSSSRNKKAKQPLQKQRLFVGFLGLLFPLLFHILLPRLYGPDPLKKGYISIFSPYYSISQSPCCRGCCNSGKRIMEGGLDVLLFFLYLTAHRAPTTFTCPSVGRCLPFVSIFTYPPNSFSTAITYCFRRQ